MLQKAALHCTTAPLSANLAIACWKKFRDRRRMGGWQSVQAMVFMAKTTGKRGCELYHRPQR